MNTRTTLPYSNFTFAGPESVDRTILKRALLSFTRIDKGKSSFAKNVLVWTHLLHWNPTVIFLVEISVASIAREKDSPT